ncbi:MAG: hypothetical protein M1822_007400 [Bathelium mastoideum]|nr:MAG: hypothetical protein M1822_007400 [Bathelium mastoideum]
MTSFIRNPDSSRRHSQGQLSADGEDEASAELEHFSHVDHDLESPLIRTKQSSQAPARHFTLRALLTGWGSAMSLPGSLMGFAIFRSLSPHLKLPFTPVENVLIQTVASAVGTMSLGCGFVGVIPALEFLLKKSEGAPIELGVGRLITWSFGVSMFGSVFAVGLRKQMVIREKLRFPSGTATALLIRVLHGEADTQPSNNLTITATYQDGGYGISRYNEEEQNSTTAQESLEMESELERSALRSFQRDQENMQSHARDKYIRLLIQASGISALYTIFTYFVPQTRDIAVFGPAMASDWLWALNPSPAYIGQGAIMGPTTTLNMLLGAIVGWGMLSPIAKYKGWAPGPVDDWEEGSKGWIMWISLAILLADSLTNLGWLLLKSLVAVSHRQIGFFRGQRSRRATSQDVLRIPNVANLFLLLQQGPKSPATPSLISKNTEKDAPPEQLVSASGISKLTQLLFALVTAKNNPNAIIINLLAGTISDSGASQAADLMQDLKTGHLLGASPKAQFYGQVIGSIFGVVISPIIYRLYVAVYDLPGRLFQIPGAYVWIFSARLIVGKGLPPMVWPFGLIAGLVFVCMTMLRIYLGNQSSAEVRNRQKYVPGGIAFAVGMYITPSYSISRAIGGVLSWCYLQYRPNEKTSIVVTASGLILGEGVFSMVNLVLASLRIPHL